MPAALMRPRLVTLLFALLLIAMQLGAQQHALAHFGEQLQRSHDQALELPVDEACAVCALFAGSSTAAPTGIAALAVPAGSFVAIGVADRSVAASAPAYYLSRAPPSLR